ncbi:hypothetical protein [Methanoregula sp.]
MAFYYQSALAHLTIHSTGSILERSYSRDDDFRTMLVEIESWQPAINCSG